MGVLTTNTRGGYLVSILLAVGLLGVSGCSQSAPQAAPVAEEQALEESAKPPTILPASCDAVERLFEAFGDPEVPADSAEISALIIRMSTEEAALVGLDSASAFASLRESFLDLVDESDRQDFEFTSQVRVDGLQELTTQAIRVREICIDASFTERGETTPNLSLLAALPYGVWEVSESENSLGDLYTLAVSFERASGDESLLATVFVQCNGPTGNIVFGMGLDKLDGGYAYHQDWEDIGLGGFRVRLDDNSVELWEGGFIENSFYPVDESDSQSNRSQAPLLAKMRSAKTMAFQGSTDGELVDFKFQLTGLENVFSLFSKNGCQTEG